MKQDFRSARGALAPAPIGSFTAFGLRAEAEPIRPGLHVVATPIGNLGDVSFRALATLAAAEAILAEDTRVTKVLLAHYGIATPLIAYHEHNAATVRPQVLARLKAGEALALVSDAGTPLVSDPGFICGRPLWQGVLSGMRDRLLSYVRPVCAAWIFSRWP